MTSKIGVYGGMFDPVHNGHIAAARFAASTLELDEVRLIPCSQPNHRDPARANSDHRVRMLELATQGEPELRVDRCELNRPGVSYTADTLDAMRAADPEQQLVLILGLDSFNSLLQWHKWQQLFDYSHFLVLNRHGAEMASEVKRQTEYARRIVEHPQQLFESVSGRIYFASEFNIEMSSSEVRTTLRADEKVRQMLDPEVSSYIDSNDLYRRGSTD